MRISVVIPSYNQARFLESTLLSCFAQATEPEIIVMDGGSKDGSVDIIRKYEKHIAYWQSKPDGGQAAAINTGMERAHGDILCWLNSDDYFLPGALDKVLSCLETHHPQLLLGNCFHFAEGSAQSHGSDLETCYHERNLLLNDYIIQPSAFWTRTLWNKVGPLESSLHYTFDWDWFIRAQRLAKIITISDYLSAYRSHEFHKTGSGGQERKSEIMCIYKRYLNSEQFKAVQEIDRHSQRTYELERSLKRFRLSSIRPTILLRKFPAIYSVFSLSEVTQIRESLKS